MYLGRLRRTIEFRDRVGLRKYAKPVVRARLVSEMLVTPADLRDRAPALGGHWRRQRRAECRARGVLNPCANGGLAWAGEVRVYNRRSVPVPNSTWGPRSTATREETYLGTARSAADTHTRLLWLALSRDRAHTRPSHLYHVSFSSRTRTRPAARRAQPQLQSRSPQLRLQTTPHRLHQLSSPRPETTHTDPRDSGSTRPARHSRADTSRSHRD
jgi:hypothetical protein